MISSPRRHLSVAVIMTSPVDLLYAVPVKILIFIFNSLYTVFLYQIKLFEECTSKHRPKQILHKTSFKSKIMLQEFENTCITLAKHLGYLNCFSSCESNDSSNSLGNGFFRNNHHFPYMSSSFQMPVELI